jgi:hypothetical protein
VAGRMRLRPGRGRAVALVRDAVLLRRHPRVAVCRPTPGVRCLRAGLLPHGRGGVRPGRGELEAGMERARRVPGRRPLPRLLPGHRVRPGSRLPRSLRPSRRDPSRHRVQVPPDHRSADATPRQGGLRPPCRLGARRCPRRELSLQP